MDMKGYRKLRQAYYPGICFEGMRESMRDLKLVGEWLRFQPGTAQLHVVRVLLIWET
jgi:hypothetical protein